MEIYEKFCLIQDAIEIGEYSPTDWEEDFLESLENKFAEYDDFEPTEKQTDVIEKLYDKIP